MTVINLVFLSGGLVNSNRLGPISSFTAVWTWFIVRGPLSDARIYTSGTNGLPLTELVY